MTVRGSDNLLFEAISPQATITEIVAVSSNPALRRIRVDGRTIATVRTTDVEEIGLENGQRFTEARRRAVAGAIALNKARRWAMHLLSRRAYTSCELIERLVRRGHDADIARRIVAQLAADHWIDDERFARDLVAEVMARKPAGRPMLLHKLAARQVPAGISDRVITEALRSTNARDDALEFARHQLQRDARSASGKKRSPAAAARRLHGMLARRGIDETIIEDVLGELGLLGIEAAPSDND